MKTLEILIPTYGRPESAALAIESCLANKDSRVSVRCHSNGHELDLERFREFDSRLTYDCFPANRGVLANFLHLFQATDARYCMLLSDEDRVDPAAMTSFLNFLDNCPETVRVVSCSIFDLENNCYFSRQDRLYQVNLDLSAVAALRIIPTYMSGLVFSVTALAKTDLVTLCQNSLGNAYPHLDISYHLLSNGYLRIYKPYFVLKGKDIKEGGDGYAHRQLRHPKIEGNADLNPLVYGPKARARQFYYLENGLISLKYHMNLAAFFLARLNLFLFHYYAILNSNTLTVIEPGVSMSTEVKLGLFNAKYSNEFSGSIMARLFCPVSTMPLLPRRVTIRFLQRAVSLLHKVMVVFVIFRSQRYEPHK